MNQEILAPLLGSDHPTVKKVIKLANEILAEGRLLNIEYLYRRAKRELQIPREGLLTIIQYMVNKKIIIDGSKFTKDTILNNSFRNLIYNFIRDNIGLHFSVIKRNLMKNLKENQIGTGQLIWHLEMLLKFRLIKSFMVGNHTIFIPVEFDENIAKIYYHARNMIRNKILRHLIIEKQCTRPVLHEAIKESRENVYYHIKILIENDYIIDNNRELSLNSKLSKYIIEAIQYLSHKKELNNKII
ncbi:MAG: hypothetical protein KGD73_10840 [Candidatus Lokiarchaeota archaeon]|nr:hypothetical protein [Candidatus Lokiarchaeota archaeon]